MTIEITKPSEITAAMEEQIQDLVNTLLQAEDKLSWTYDDANDILTIDTTALDSEEVIAAVESTDLEMGVHHISGLDWIDFDGYTGPDVIACRGGNINMDGGDLYGVGTINDIDANLIGTGITAAEAVTAVENESDLNLRNLSSTDLDTGVIDINTHELKGVTTINDIDANLIGTGVTAAEAVDAINNDVDHGSTAQHDYTIKYTDAEAVTAIDDDSDHGSTAQHNYTTRYTDSEAVTAIESTDLDMGGHYIKDLDWIDFEGFGDAIACRGNNINMGGGDIDDAGTITATTKNFQIDHPLYDDKELVHGSLEGPENGVYYRGKGKLENGETVIELPEYFEELTRQMGRTVQLTAKGKEPFMLSYEEIEDGRFKVFGTAESGEFAWTVMAERADIEKLEVEPVEAEKGGNNG